MFAVLEHRSCSDDLSGSAEPAAAPAVHWDLLVEVPGQERLATWQLSANPAEVDGRIAARRIADHRRVYLEYEGPLSNARGWVRRVDRGEALVRGSEADGVITLELQGETVRGTFEIVTSGTTAWWRRLPPAAHKC